ncbi:PD-(D/E)XK nuclease family transposase [Butyrivibrio sp. AE2032]|uniref:PD-(D/E)XK nuclease family transposase n=1 Tax=Butyrivibrio sp. AE2032 TaxID=1458463 RepID=UPI000550EF6C|nr:PD-(D/E)XK nuclease family transposase [Butyrivibrio sp. AE2032]
MKERDRKLSEEDMLRVRALRLIDDAFMTVCFDGYIEGAQLLLNIILDRDDLTVTEVRSQKVLKSLRGRDVWLDIYATDKEGVRYNVEVQRADKGADIKRARYHSSMIDADMLNPGDDFSELNENYVIFITENDVMGLNRPIYRIERHIEADGYLPFNDGEHIIYVNGSARVPETALGKLMSDFFCTEAEEMNYKELSDRVRFYKETEKGAKTMGSVIDELREEGEMKARTENALKMLANNKLTLEEVAEYSGLSLEKIRELAGNKTA